MHRWGHGERKRERARESERAREGGRGSERERESVKVRLMHEWLDGRLDR